MKTLDEIIDSVREASGADLAFVLTRKGRLVTKRAPQDMPEQGRQLIVSIGEAILAGRPSPARVELPREALIPFGGAAPVDIYVTARPEAILCAVMATFTPPHGVSDALAVGVAELEALMDAAAEKRDHRRGKPAAKATKTAGVRKKTMPPPAFHPANPRDTIPWMGDAPPQKPTRKRTVPPPAPEITFHEEPMGRATLEAIDLEAEGPEISYGLAAIGRQTIADIEFSVVPQGDPRSSAPTVEVGLDAMPDLDGSELDPLGRNTLPFVESAPDALRSHARALPRPPPAAPKTRSVVVGRASTRPPKPRGDAAAGEPAAPIEPAPRNPRDSSLNAWHRALTEMVEPNTKAKKPAPRR